VNLDKTIVKLQQEKFEVEKLKSDLAERKESVKTNVIIFRNLMISFSRNYLISRNCMKKNTVSFSSEIRLRLSSTAIRKENPGKML
jgi:hypothetical protein